MTTTKNLPTLTTTESIALDCALRAFQDERCMDQARFDAVLASAITFASTVREEDVYDGRVRAVLAHHITVCAHRA